MNNESHLKRQLEYQIWKADLEKQFQYLKNADIEEYFPRIMYIARQMKEH